MSIISGMMTGPSPSYRPDRGGRFTVACWWLVLAVSAAFYCATAQRTISWQDSGMFQWRVLTGSYSGDLGLALAHPLYIAGGRLLTLVSQKHLPLLLNCFSGLGMAVALANLAGLATLLTGKRWIGLLTSAMLAVTHTVWWLSTIAEVYTWSAAGLTAELWLLVMLIYRPRWAVLAGLALVNGLGLCVHNFALLALPVYLTVAVVLVVRRKLPAWTLAAAAGAYVVGAGMYLVMIAELAIRTGDIPGAIRSALFGDDFVRHVLNVASRSPHQLENAVFSAMNFVNLLLPLAAIGYVRMRRRLGAPVAWALGAISVVQIVFFVRYPVPDQFTFILPTLTVLAVAAAIGMETIAGVSRKWRVAATAIVVLSILWQPAFYAVAPGLARRLVGQVRPERTLPFRDEARYWLVPWKHNERSAELFAEDSLKKAEPNAVIITDPTALHPLLIYQRLQGVRPDVSIRSGAGDSVHPRRDSRELGSDPAAPGRGWPRQTG